MNEKNTSLTPLAAAVSYFLIFVAFYHGQENAALAFLVIGILLTIRYRRTQKKETQPSENNAAIPSFKEPLSPSPSPTKKVLKIIGVILLIPIVIGMVVGMFEGRSKSTSNYSAPATTAPAMPDISWMEGGTLHKANVAEWRVATQANKLATCADFAARIKKSKKEEYYSIGEMRSEAEYIMNCLEETTKEPTQPTMKVTDLAAACVFLKEEK